MIIKRMITMLVLALGLFAVSPHYAFAAPPPPVSTGACTTDPQFQPPPVEEGKGLISTIVTQVQTILDSISQTMFETIASDSGFAYSVRAAITLYIAIYGILFTFGMVQLTLFDFSKRMIKIGILVMLLSPDAWGFFSEIVVRFFNDGTNSIISEVTNIAVGAGIPSTSGTYPFAILDDTIAKAVSAKMAVTLLAIFFTGMYGILFGTLLLVSLGSFVRALLTAVWVYLMSLVLKSLLFGIAPIFLSFLLFDRTRHLFDGWLNQIVNACLQPILLFVFFAFFATLIQSSIEQILQVPVCWTEAADSMRGSPYHMHYWRFEILNSSGAYEPYGGAWSWMGPELDVPNNNLPAFPIDIMSILIFLILAELASRFNDIILMLAADLAGATTNLASMDGALSNWFSSSKVGQTGPINSSGSGVLRTMGKPGEGGQMAHEQMANMNAVRNQGQERGTSGSIMDQISGWIGGR